MTNENGQGFGGEWTKQKLDILERYLGFYTTALKNQNFELLYIDAFAGMGGITYNDEDAKQFIEGSVRRALKVTDRPFDKFIFVEKRGENYEKLKRLKSDNPSRTIDVHHKEANEYLRDELSRLNWEKCRGVLFLDPFATEVEWSTIKAIASYHALDTWILFPVSAVMRMMPKAVPNNPKDLPCADKLDKIFGDDSWNELYRRNPQANLFGDENSIRDSGAQGVLRIYKSKLEELFGERFLPKSKTLMNSKNSPLFEFMFCVGNVRGKGPAFRAAKHIIENF